MNEKNLPTNIAAIVPVCDSDNQKTLVEKALKGAFSDSLEEALVKFSLFGPLKVTFSEPVDVHRMGRGHIRLFSSWEKTNTPTFARLFNNDGKCPLCYLRSRRHRKGYSFPASLTKVVAYEVVLKNRKDEFKSFEQFKAKFDPKFILDDLVKDLWNSKSGQHGGKYRPSDFRRLGPVGRDLVRQLYANGFTDIRNVTYEDGKVRNSSNGARLYVRHYSYGGKGNFGRDITIEAMAGRIGYSSEYPGCGNGRYGLLVTERTFLWLEDD